MKCFSELRAYTLLIAGFFLPSLFQTLLCGLCQHSFQWH
ncbi:hypothetical protein SLEP1_g25525 [Rubroshorea leprosula]|uniref:Uncharacterized protein n=1 Tax=Rubroshorea leprosula TaxID=152421 RepID=A0AAV5JJC5_9ROSI|nr:hypothetical protein SLEP1_g25525 [Rubroshorea leprosula]